MDDDFFVPGSIRPVRVPLAAEAQGLRPLPMPRSLADAAPELLPYALDA